MPSAGSLVLHTTASTFQSRSQIYDRVVGIEYAAQTLWLDPNRFHRDLSAGFDKSLTAAVELEVTDEFALRAVEFFDRYMTRIESVDDNYNCHLFGDWMSGDPLAKVRHGARTPYDIVRLGIEVDPPLELGRHGVFGKKYEHGAVEVTHSIVGLNDPRRCMEVIAVCGYMAIEPYENTKRFFEDYRLYAANPESLAA